MRARPGMLMLATALVAGGLTMLPLSKATSAMTLQLNPLNSTPQNAETAHAVEKVARRARRHRRYERRRHGRRYRAPRGRHKHYHGGYWYRVPWWLGLPYVGTPYYDPYYDVVPAPRRSAHVNWCLRRYRSYNPRTDTFRGYDGYDHRCRSPYRR